MKTAKVFTQKVYSFACPECGAEIENTHNGSLNWTKEDLNFLFRCIGATLPTVTCQDCGATVRIPERLTK